MIPTAIPSGTHFTCFTTSTKVQILTPEEQSLQSLQLGQARAAAPCRCSVYSLLLVQKKKHKYGHAEGEARRKAVSEAALASVFVLFWY